MMTQTKLQYETSTSPHSPNNQKTSRIKEFCLETEQNALTLKKEFRNLENKRILEKCLNKELSLNLKKTKTETNKYICKSILSKVISALVKTQNRKHKQSEKLKTQKKIELLKRETLRQKSLFNEKVRCFKFSEQNLIQSLENSNKKLASFRAEVGRAEKRSEEVAFLNRKLKNLSFELELQRKTLRASEATSQRLRGELKERSKLCGEKQEKLLFLSKSVERAKEECAGKIRERFAHEQRSVEKLLGLHRDERSEYEKTIAKRDAEIKELISKLGATEETIRKMGRNLLSLSRNEADEALKKKLEAASLEKMKLKSRIANLMEIKDSQPPSIREALRKGFRVEKDYSQLKDRYDHLKEKTEKQKTEIEGQRKRIEELQNKFEFFKVECEQRTGFYRSVTHSILERFKKTFEASGRTGEIAGLEEMFSLISKCENSQLATPRLKRVVSCFGKQSEPSVKKLRD